MKTETQVLSDVCKWLEKREFFFWRANNVPAAGRSFGSFRSLPKYTPQGIADILVVHQGILIAFEVKRPGSDDEREPNGRKVRAGRLSLEQAEWAANLTIAGGKYFVVRSTADVESALASIFAKGWTKK